MAALTHYYGKRLYLAANILIYSFEGVPEFQPVLTAMFACIDDGRISAATSELSLAELLVRPIRSGDVSAQQTCRQFLTSRPNFDVLPIGREILNLAAQLRAQSSMKLPDAIHAATAELNACDCFITNDRRMSALEKIQIALLAEIQL